MIPSCRGGAYGLISRIGYGRHHWRTYVGQSEGYNATITYPFGSHTIGEQRKNENSVVRAGTRGADGLGVRARASITRSNMSAEAPEGLGARRGKNVAVLND